MKDKQVVLGAKGDIVVRCFVPSKLFLTAVVAHSVVNTCKGMVLH